MADKNFGKKDIFWLLSGVLTGCLIVVVGNQKERIEHMQRVQDSLLYANDSLQDKVIEYRSALKAYENRYANQGK